MRAIHIPVVGAAPHARRRIPDLGPLLDHDQVATQGQISSSTYAEAVNLADDRLLTVEQTHESSDVSVHHGVVDHRVPDFTRVVIVPLHVQVETCSVKRGVARFGGRLLGEFDQIVSAAESGTAALERDDVNGWIEAR
jgi:hypothetical protein